MRVLAIACFAGALFSGVVHASGMQSTLDPRLTATSAQCSKAIKKLCSQLTDADLQRCADLHEGDNKVLLAS